MPDPRQFTYTHPEHGEITVDLPDGVFTKDEVEESFVAKAVHNNEMARLRTASKNLVDPDSLLEDEDFRARALESWGVNPEAHSQDEAAVAKQIAERVEAKRQEWEKTVLGPLQKQNESLSNENTRLRERDLSSEIMSVAASMVKPGLLKSPVSGGTAPIVNMLRPFFAYDPETGRWAVKKADGDGFAYSSNPSEDNPYKGPAEFLKEWASDSDNADFLLDDKQRGADHKNAGDAPKGGVIRLSYEDSRNAQVYRQAQERAEKTGARIEVEYPGQ